MISHDVFNQHPAWRSLNIVPLSTSKRQLRNRGSAVLIPTGESGLRQDSVALCHQITTIDRSKLEDFAGTLSTSALRRVEEGLMLALDLLG